MMDDSHMDAIEVVSRELFGDAIDPRELSDFVSKMNDASEVHVNQDLSGAADKQRRRKKIVNTVGQGLNALAIGAGGHALLMAGRDERLANSKNPVARTLAAPYKAWAKTSAGKAIGPKSRWGRKYAIPLAAGAVGLHTAELVGDSIAARALHEQRNSPPPAAIKAVSDAAAQKGKIKQDAVANDIHIKKALADIVEARRKGVISTDMAIQMSSELVEKAAGMLNPDSKEIHQMAESLVPMAAPTKKLSVKPKKVKGTQPAVPNRVPEQFGKSESPALTWTGEIAKTDTEKRQVFGYCTVTHVNGEPVVDRQGDYVPLDEIEKAAYSYVINSRKGGDMHKRDGDQPLHTSDMVESFVVTPEKLEKMGLDANAVPHGWWVGFKINDDQQWEDVKAGKRTSFSIHGSGKRVEKMMED